MQDPAALYRLTDTAEGLRAEHLLVAMDGFVDAGNTARASVRHLQETLPHEVVAEFDLDALYDYRARRPRIRLEENVATSVTWRTLRLELQRDLTDTPFLVLSGPEPDRAWQAFAAAVLGLAARFGVNRMTGMLALPGSTPHTRPITFLGTATRTELLPEGSLRFGPMEVPGSLVSVLEWTFGQAGRDAATLVPQVPNYLSQSEVPHASAALLRRVGSVTGLSLPVDGLLQEAEKMDVLLEQELAQSPENRTMVAELEKQYDESLANLAGAAGGTTVLPTGDEIARQFEDFLAQRDDDR